MAKLEASKWHFNKQEDVTEALGDILEDMESDSPEAVHQGITAFRSVICGDDGGQGILRYLQQAPDCSHLVAAFDAQNSANVTKNCVSLMYTLADILRFKRQERSLTGGVSTAALQLDTVARAMLVRIKAVSAHLASGIRGRVHSALALLTAITGRNKA
eukprot:CAMPEP_0182886308 /NCGR_PEP_ID=MMETSP0034_2-20130328/20136_1 /TAXON_ID=156128 /ORGANISM="Nephroselmis pyriformis, Strain CCMP717" /LENGTH=158 /DNA_ID=CAMNT_0025019623 /DNA_START=139 /DNA_END=611 /DNA_ORIENTATION=-